MVFNSFLFLFGFLPVTLAGFKICRHFWGAEAGTVFLILASLVFYGWNYPQCLPVLLGSMLVNFLLVKMVPSRWGKPIGIMINVGVLFFFKFGKLLWGLDGDMMAAPGISFFTFSQIAFVMESYRGNRNGMDVKQYGLYITFFPKLMQGPLVMPEDFCGKKKGETKADWENILRQLLLIILGLFKKVLLADTLGKAVSVGYAGISGLNSLDAAIVMLSYTLQLYFDFSGYCDMAMGIAALFGYELPLNFDSPYRAENIIEFWKRWHITLTRFLTKYVYIPLGGNRKGRVRMYLNYLVVFLVSGIWHGAGWQFVIWGMMHGVLYAVTKLFSQNRKSGNRIVHAGKVIFTFAYVNLAWVFFRAPSVKDAFLFLNRLFTGGIGKINWELAGAFNLDEFWYIIKLLGADSWQYAHYMIMLFLLLVMLVIIFACPNAVKIAQKSKLTITTIIAMAVLLVWSVLSFSEVSTFLYFNF